MRKRLFIASIVVALIALLGLGLRSALAQDGGPRSRTELVEISTAEYTWRLISNATGQSVCEVKITHQGQPTDTEALDICTHLNFLAQPTVTPGGPQVATATPIPASSIFRLSTWRLVDTKVVKQTVEVRLPDLIVYIGAPNTPVKDAYVVITAYEPVPKYEITAIEGRVGTSDRLFQCKGSRCEVPISTDTRITFWAKSSHGSESTHYTAAVITRLTADGYVVTLEDVSYLGEFNDSCASLWGLQTPQSPPWVVFPQSPADMHTEKELHYLASQLITSGMVNASDCPGGGFIAAGAPNACGIDKARAAMIATQNQYDPTIWMVGQAEGIPPRLMKAIIEQETQFWPGSSRSYLFEYGLFQMNDLGADVVLRWDNDIYKQICSELKISCPDYYASLPGETQAMVRGAYLRKIDANCPTCDYGIDFFVAEQSITLLAQAMYTNCQQTQFILNQHQATADYEDLWRFTMVSYHGGYKCLDDAIARVTDEGKALTWANISAGLNCMNARDYVNSIWEKLLALGEARAIPFPLAPTIIPTYVMLPTAIPPTPQPPVNIEVTVYYDANENNVIDTNEMLDDVEVQALFNGRTYTQRTVDGLATFSISGPVSGNNITLSLPSVYRQIVVQVPSSRKISYTFRLEAPDLPNVLP